MANRVVHFEIEAQNLERAKKFYTQAFGWEMQQMGEDMGNYVLITTGDEKEPGGINGGMMKSLGDKKDLNAYSCVVQVESIDDSMQKVKSSGGEVLGEKMEIPGVGTYVKCKDTEGNNFSLLQPPAENA